MLRLGWNCIFEVAEITNTLGSTLRACVCVCVHLHLTAKQQT